MDDLKNAVFCYASRHADSDGLVETSIPGLRLMFCKSAAGDLHSIYRPLICMILQGAKRMVIGNQEQVFVAGQSVIVSADMPVAGRIVQADETTPYMAIAVELDFTTLTEVAQRVTASAEAHVPQSQTFFTVDTDNAALDCATRMLRLVDTPRRFRFCTPASCASFISGCCQAVMGKP